MSTRREVGADVAGCLDLVRWAVRRWGRPGESADDLMAAGLYGLAQAAANYRGPDYRGAKFSTYAAVCIRSQIAAWRRGERRFRVRRGRRRGRAWETRVALFSELGGHFVRGRARAFAVEPEPPRGFDPFDGPAGFVAWVRGRLDDRGWFVLSRLAGLHDGGSWTLARVAEEAGVCKERVRQVQVRAVLRLRRDCPNPPELL